MGNWAPKPIVINYGLCLGPCCLFVFRTSLYNTLGAGAKASGPSHSKGGKAAGPRHSQRMIRQQAPCHSSPGSAGVNHASSLKQILLLNCRSGSQAVEQKLCPVWMRSSSHRKSERAAAGGACRSHNTPSLPTTVAHNAKHIGSMSALQVGHTPAANFAGIAWHFQSNHLHAGTQ